MKILVTGGAGFIGSNFIRYLLAAEPDAVIVNFDALTYAGNLASLKDVESNPRYLFVKGDISDPESVKEVFANHQPEIVINFAAESHVDRSILSAAEFVRANVMGTQVLLGAAREFKVSRFCQVSTDEVYGSLKPGDPPFVETTPLQANSPYAASKAGADLLVRSYVHTHGLDAVITRCSNNYGSYQFPEKFIPLFTINAMRDQELPLYGDGRNVRDWIHVLDHCDGVWSAAKKGRAGEVYNFGCDNEWANIDIAHLLLEILGKPQSLIKLVKDRPGHDRRYAMGFAKAARELDWQPQVQFETGLAETVRWYQQNTEWWSNVISGEYQSYYQRQYGKGGVVG
jgi:dTDP-glucose 4,6-dehydratase